MKQRIRAVPPAASIKGAPGRDIRLPLAELGHQVRGFSCVH